MCCAANKIGGLAKPYPEGGTRSGFSTPRAAWNAGCIVSRGGGRGSERGEGSERGATNRRGGVPERPKGADCKSAALTRYEGSNPSPTTRGRGRSSVGRASAFQAEGHGFEPRRPLCTKNARVAQSVERVLGKDEVTGSIPVASSVLN